MIPILSFLPQRIRLRAWSSALLPALAVVAGALTTSPVQAQDLASLTTVHRFTTHPIESGLVLGADGAFYGTTDKGGDAGLGSIFRVTTAGALTTFASFHGIDSDSPRATLIKGADGNFYGTTYAGGVYGYGTVFQCTTAGVLTTLYSFDGTNGSNPYAALLQTSDGSFYGTTSAGGDNSAGTVFKITSAGVFSIVHSFTYNDGVTPRAALILGTDGNFYGTCRDGGPNGYGTVYQMTTGGVVTVLYGFDYNNSGGYVDAGVIQSSDGNFYGTASSGGVNGSGTIYKLTPTGTLTVLRSFNGTDGSTPEAKLLRGNDGLLYGTTSNGGANSQGVVFRISTTGTYTLMRSFNGTTGARPFAGLAQGSDGNFYGTTRDSSASNEGTVFRITPSSVFTSLYTFHADGNYPQSPLLRASDGTFYGTATYGGDNGAGTVFRISSTGAYSTIYTFLDANDGRYPVGGLVQGTDGLLYGIASAGGSSGYGTVFRLTPAGVLTTLRAFQNNSSDGVYPAAGLVLATDGNFYGTTTGGGSNGYGTIFKISSSGTYTPLYSFSGTDGQSSSSTLIQGSDGNFYGTTNSGGTNNYGTVFRVTPAGALTTLHSFNGTDDGNQPEGRLLRTSDGTIYGTTQNENLGNAYGTIFQINPTGVFSTLYGFSSSDGANPYAGLIQGNDGNLYGTTNSGGDNGQGTIFRFKTTGELETIYSFSSSSGTNPQAELIQTPDGNFYGTTVYGGDSDSYGTVFQFSLKPAITSALVDTAIAGQEYSYYLSATNTPTSLTANGLPDGLTINTNTGLISGTPTTVGTYNVAVAATNFFGTTSATLVLNVVALPPVITSDLNPSARVDTAFTYQITATNSPTSYDATSLAPGLSIDQSTGIISGTPTTVGTYHPVISATNSGGTGQATLNIVVKAALPVITSATDATGLTGNPFTYQITATNSPTSYGATGLPAGLTVNTTTGAITGTPTAVGTFGVILKATNAGGTATANLNLVISVGPPVISSTLSATGQVGVAFNYQIAANNSPTSFAASGLPDGLSVNGSTGLISGTPTTPATSSVTISATNSTGTGSATLSLLVKPATPVLNSPLTATGQVGVAFSYQISATNSPTSYSATGLPAGTSISTSTGVISGTPTAAGTFNITISAINSGGTGTATVSVTITPATPVITSSLSPTGQVNVAFSYQIAASNNPTSYSATGLPAGLSVNTTTGKISGTPTAPGTFSLTVSATNAGGTGTATLSLLIKPAPPVINSTLTATGQVGVLFSYQIAATNSPTGFNASGLPSGLSVDTTTGIISGTPTAPGTASVVISASNTGGNGSATLRLTINPANPVISSTLTGTGQVGVSFSYQISASNNPTSYSANGLPAGLSVSTSTGVISGKATVAGTFSITISATNAGGTGTATLSLLIKPANPVITSALTATGTTGVAFSYQIVATNAPTSYSATGLPAGLSVDAATGIISGTPTAVGTSSVAIKATNSGGTGSATLSLTINPPAPVITSSVNLSGQVGVAFTYQIIASNSPTSYSTSSTPPGLSFSTSTGKFTGTPTAAGTYKPLISAINAGGTGSVNLNLVVQPPNPVISSSLTATARQGSAFIYQITASNTPTSFSATGLPTGLSITASTGKITGTPTVFGTFSVTIGATNGGGTGTATLSIAVKQALPVINSATTATARQGVAFSYQITATNSPTSYAATGLPSGVTVSTTTGVISGTPTVNGTFSARIYATNGGGTGSSGALSIVVKKPLPVITSSLNATGQVGVAFSYQIVASNSPTTYAATGLPAGLSISTSTGKITGTPTAAGTTSVTISASNSDGTGSATLVLVVNPPKPVITSASSITGQVGVAFSYQITATNTPTSFAATNLPTGLTVNATTGKMSGTPTAIGTFNVVITATNSGGSGSAGLSLVVRPPTPVITSSLSASGQINVAFVYQIVASNNPTSYSATGLPTGLSVDASTGKISGTPTVAGTYSVTIKAINTGGTGSATLSLVIKPPAPAVTSALSASGRVGVSFLYQITGTNTPTSYAATGLPAGLTLSTTTGKITGTPTAAGTYSVTIKAINSGGSGSATLTIEIKPAIPVITSTLSASGTKGAAFTYQITATNSPTSYAVTNLPAGLSLNATTGKITGAPTVTGTFGVTIKAINSGGTGSATLTLTIN